MPGARLQTGGLILLGRFQVCFRSRATRTPACERVESPFTGPRSSRACWGLLGEGVEQMPVWLRTATSRCGLGRVEERSVKPGPLWSQQFCSPLSAPTHDSGPRWGSVCLRMRAWWLNLIQQKRKELKAERLLASPCPWEDTR